MPIIKPNQPGIYVPPVFIKEELDQAHRHDWEDPDRYTRQRDKALRYIQVRAKDIKDFSWEQLVRETARIFHDDLAADPDVKEAAQKACWAAKRHHQLDVDLEIATAAADPESRGEVRGVDDEEETIASLEWQEKENQDSW